MKKNFNIRLQAVKEAANTYNVVNHIINTLPESTLAEVKTALETAESEAFEGFLKAFDAFEAACKPHGLTPYYIQPGGHIMKISWEGEIEL